MERCKYCGEPLTERSKFCPNCGQPRAAVTEAKFMPAEEPAQAEITEAEFVIEEPEEASAAQSPRVDHVVVPPEKPKAEAKRREQPPQRPSDSERAEPLPPSGRRAPLEKKASKLSVWAFICTLTLLLSGLGIILAIVDLVKGDQQTKHGLSKAALVIGGVFLVLAWIGNTFMKPKMLAEYETPTQRPAAVSGKATPAPAKTKKPQQQAKKATAAPKAVKSGTPIQVPEYGLIAVLTDPNWTYSVTSDGILVVRATEKTETTSRILLTSERTANLPENMRTPEALITAYMQYQFDIKDVSPFTSVTVNGGYAGRCFERAVQEGGVNMTLKAVAWSAGERSYLALLGDASGKTDAKTVFNDILNTFQPAQAAAPKQNEASQKAPARVVSILYGNGTLAGLRSDGTVALTGFKARNNKMDVSDWTNIVAIDTNYNGDYLVGLRGDGTVIATGEIRTEALQQLRSWRNIVSIDADESYGYVAGVRVDGTVTAVRVDREPGVYDTLPEKVAQWTDVATVKLFNSNAYGRRKDGTWVNTEVLQDGLWTKRYEDAADIYMIDSAPVILYPNGDLKILWEHTRYDISGWRNIQKLLLKSSLAVGLKKDGTAVAVCSDRMREYLEKDCEDISSWRDLIDVASDGTTTVGLKKDGSLVFAGSKFDFDEKEWTKAGPAAGQNQPRLTPAPMRSASKKDDSADRQRAVAQILDLGTKNYYKDEVPYYSRRDYAALLKREFSEDVIWYALNHSGIDWQANAVRYARRQILEKEKYCSEKDLMRDLRLKLYSPEEIEYARTHWNLNFKAIALAVAKQYINSQNTVTWTKERMIQQLEHDGFTHEEAVYGAEKLGLK